MTEYATLADWQRAHPTGDLYELIGRAVDIHRRTDDVQACHLAEVGRLSVLDRYMGLAYTACPDAAWRERVMAVRAAHWDFTHDWPTSQFTLDGPQHPIVASIQFDVPNARFLLQITCYAGDSHADPERDTKICRFRRLIYWSPQ